MSTQEEPCPSRHQRHTSSTKSVQRVSTVCGYSPDEVHPRVKKRLIVCCDGTWQDGIGVHRSKYTNVMRLTRAINSVDIRGPDEFTDDVANNNYKSPIPQIVYYQSGIGSDGSLYSEYIEGTTGGSLADKIEEAYAFIAHNYFPGDEIYLFGFSRGAYTVRMVAMFIGAIGVLDHKDMDHFAEIFCNFQQRGKCDDPEKRKEFDEKLAQWTSPDAVGKKRVDVDGDGFSIKCIGVWETVGSIGLPDELKFNMSSSKRKLFGFPDSALGEHIQYAFQALALHERRQDFNCNKFEQSAIGRKKGQVLKQCWFAGSHTDIGGGYEEHDLSDITLIWMAANVERMLSLDTMHLAHLLDPVAEWGKQKPHDSRTGIFILATTAKRTLPTFTDDVTREYIHPSVLEQLSSCPDLEVVVKQNPKIICKLMGLEIQMKKLWRYDPSSSAVKRYTNELAPKAIPARPSGTWEIGAKIGELLATISRGSSFKASARWFTSS